MVEYGKMFTCNRCGKEKFVPKPDPMKLVDPPPCWGCIDGKDLCPDCNELYNNLLNVFFAPEVKRSINFDEVKRYGERNGNG